MKAKFSQMKLYINNTFTVRDLGSNSNKKIQFFGIYKRLDIRKMFIKLESKYTPKINRFNVYFGSVLNEHLGKILLFNLASLILTG